MTQSANKLVVERLLTEVVNLGRAAAFEELVSPDYYDHDPLPGTPHDRNGLAQRFAIRGQAFPDFKARIVQMVEEGDRVALLMTGTGTHMGEFMGVAPTGRHFTISELHIFRVYNGLLVEHWGLTDFYGLLSQLQLVESPWNVPVGAS